MSHSLVPALSEVSAWILLVLCVLGIGILLLRKVRSGPAKQESTASELLSKFRELHSEGELSDAEYRTIKTQLAAKLQQQIKGNGDKG
jgi:uncharacterized membrane protein